MSYTNLTGKNIGNCLTGFGIHYPLTIYNSGNGEVLYNINNSNSTNFSLSNNSLLIGASDYDSIDIFYKPTLTSAVVDEITTLTISSTSVEDGSVDPSGDINIYITGSKLINITGGNPRSFRVVGDSKNVQYDFYWKHPTGISGVNLRNYFITGYRLDLHKNATFTDLAYSKDFNIVENTNLNPKFSTYYGFSDNDIQFVLNKDLYTDLAAGQDYYARLYSLTNNNTGVSIYATKVNSQVDAVSEDVFLGYSGAPNNIKIAKKAFDFTETVATRYNYSYDLYNKLIVANGNSNDFSAYSGINVYLPEKSLFESVDTSKGAIVLDGTFMGLSGDASTFINIYVPLNTEIAGAYGVGTNVYYTEGMGEGMGITFNGHWPILEDASSLLSRSQNNNNTTPNDPLKAYSDTTNGGPCLTLKAKTDLGGTIGTRTDFKYNIYSQLPNINDTTMLGDGIVCRPKFGSGSGGGKGGFAYLYNYTRSFYFSDTIDRNSKLRWGIIPFNGNYPKGYFVDTGRNRKYWYYIIYYGNQSRTYVNVDTGDFLRYYAEAYTINSPILIEGEVGSAYLTYTDEILGNAFFPRSSLSGGPLSERLGEINYTILKKIIRWYPFNKDLNNRQPGFLIDSLSNSSVNFSIYNKSLPSDFVFRFSNDGIDTSNGNWTDTTTTKTLTNSGGIPLSNYQSLGSSSYKAIKLKNSQNLQYSFTDTVTFGDFDLFFICSFDDFDDPGSTDNFYASIFDWYSSTSPNNITSDQFNIRIFPDLQRGRYVKEKLSFFYKNKSLSNSIDRSRENGFGGTISQQLYIKKQISNVNISTNVFTTSTNHDLANNDRIAFFADTLPNPLKSYDSSSPYSEDKNIYTVSHVTPNTFKLGATDITTTGSNVSILKIKSASLYRPFILQIRRVNQNYTLSINREVISRYIGITDLITNLKGTTLKLINRNATIGINYFDVTFYNRLLSNTELNSAYAYYVDNYLSLFTGEANCTSINLKSNLYNFRLPNIFNLAGKS